MQSVEWGFLYNQHHTNNTMSATVLEREVAFLRADVGRDGNSHLDNTKGIYRKEKNIITSAPHTTKVACLRCCLSYYIQVNSMNTAIDIRKSNVIKVRNF